MQKSSRSTIELHDEDELVIEALLTFLYTWNYALFFVDGGGASAKKLKTVSTVYISYPKHEISIKFYFYG
jgi:hypothetical protein